VAALGLFAAPGFAKGRQEPVQTGDDPQQVLEFTVVNKTGYSIEELYAVPAYSGFQTADLLDNRPLVTEHSRKIAFEPVIAAQFWDFTALDAYGTEYTVTGISLRKNSVVVFESGDASESDNSPEEDLEEAYSGESFGFEEESADFAP
jgi:hypothetical protein